MAKKEKTEHEREYMREYNAILNMRIYRPDGPMPRGLIRNVRVRCCEMGGDLGVSRDIRMAIHSLWEETEEHSLEWQWFHPEESVITANRISSTWYRSSEKFHQKFFTSLQVECSQFEL